MGLTLPSWIWSPTRLSRSGSAGRLGSTGAGDAFAMIVVFIAASDLITKCLRPKWILR